MQANNPDFKVKVREGGRVVIPSVYRKAMGLRVGDELVMRFKSGELRLFQQVLALKHLRATVKRKSIGAGVQDFLKLRKIDSGV